MYAMVIKLPSLNISQHVEGQILKNDKKQNNDDHSMKGPKS